MADPIITGSDDWPAWLTPFLEAGNRVLDSAVDQVFAAEQKKTAQAKQVEQNTPAAAVQAAVGVPGLWLVLVGALCLALAWIIFRK